MFISMPLWTIHFHDYYLDNSVMTCVIVISVSHAIHHFCMVFEIDDRHSRSCPIVCAQLYLSQSICATRSPRNQLSHSTNTICIENAEWQLRSASAGIIISLHKYENVVNNDVRNSYIQHHTGVFHTVESM